MGNQHNSDQFNPSDWTKIGSDSNLPTLWQNNHNPHIHIQQYLIYSKNQEQLNLQKQLYFQRKNHPYWVSAYYFQQQKNNLVCMLGNAAHIYIQKIPISIHDLRELSLGDLIHSYNQCLQGFKTLSQILGFFRVSDKFIGINERGVVKVWAGQQWSKVGMILNQITEQEMVYSIFKCLQRFSFGLNQLPILINDFLRRSNEKLTFNLAIDELRNFALQFNQGFIPSRIQTQYSNQNSVVFFDPLIRSTHHHMLLQSKYIPTPQASNSSLYKYNKKLQNVRVKLSQIKEQSKSLGKFNSSKNAKTPLSFFSCMNIQQQKKTSKIFTKQEMIKHYGDYFQFQEKSNNYAQFQGDNKFINYDLKSHQKQLYNAQKPNKIQKMNQTQEQPFHQQNHFSAQQNNNFKRFSFQNLKKQQQINYHNPQVYGPKINRQLNKNDDCAQKTRGISLGVNNQSQFIRYNPTISFRHLNNYKSPQLSANLQPQRNQITQTCMKQSQSKMNIYSHIGPNDRKISNILQRSIKEPSKSEFIQRVQKIHT